MNLERAFERGTQRTYTLERAGVEDFTVDNGPGRSVMWRVKCCYVRDGSRTLGVLLLRGREVVAVEPLATRRCLAEVIATPT